MSRTLAPLLVVAVACGGRGVNSPSTTGTNVDPGAIRYRLKLRHNRVDPGAAFRCYGACQDAPSPKEYVECLSACPGFEKTPGMACDPMETPPESACLTVRKVPLSKEPDPGLVVLAVIGQVALVVGAASVCKASSSRCQSPPLGMPPPF
jgi:hypothetical protein